jgi:hypothetical protein
LAWKIHGVHLPEIGTGDSEIHHNGRVIHLRKDIRSTLLSRLFVAFQTDSLQ